MRSLCPFSVRSLRFRLSLLGFRCASQPLLDRSLLGGYSDNVVWMRYKGLDDYDNDDHVIAAVLKLASLRLHVRTC